MNRVTTSSLAFATLFITFILVSYHRETRAARESDMDFVEVVKINPKIKIKLPYATKDNFTKIRLYPVERCFLRRRVANRLDQIQKDLEPKGLGLKIWDGYRPHRVQYIMWDKSPTPGYVGNPKRGSRHNRGAAVDVTLVDLETGEELPMATPYDEFSKRAGAYYSRLPAEIKKNRKTLQDAMTKRGFKIMSTEWWHFDAIDWYEFPLANIPLEDLVKQTEKEEEKEE